MAKPWEKRHNKKSTFDEFYTLYENCEAIFRDILPIINEQTKTKNDTLTVCCPCDSEKSNIVKWLQANTTWNIIYFGDKDVNSEEARDIMLKADVIITNPPFSLSIWRPFITWLIDNKKNFFVFGPTLQTSARTFVKLVYENSYTYFSKNFPKTVFIYDTPNDGRKPVNTTSLYTSYDVPYPDYEYKEPSEPVELYEGIPVFNKTKNIPKDYMGWMYVPSTSMIYFKYLELDDTKRGVPGKYTRYCIRRAI